ncbi:Predicted secreted hydrolase [Halopseudomonas xinjiangensis]|uniref:Predicted secreted hydrolase n=1 Tax=Halopseudomonas xinjiangensis TaxID=487184 RepID=A0A1H1Z055_9GAMM|nr:lipocalin-like domain-containing protein [Halopseudomonas xinjiangensis]SDT26979.1 Predicted secreted hydrolase [Halopseudomonas xinjiangensis]
MKVDFRLVVVWLLLMLSGCEQSGESPQGFAGLGAQAEGFEQVKAGAALRFPDDHLPHPQFRIEWWYVTANLKDQQGRDWGVQWTLFRQAMEPQNQNQAADGWASAQVWLGHAALSNENLHLYADRLARGGIGQAGVSASPFTAWIDHWSLTAPSAGSTEEAKRLGELRVRAAADGFAYDLRLHSEGPLVLHGDAGVSRKSQGRQASYYYSQPFYQVEGMLEVEGEPVSVTGQAWLDREWSSQPLAADQRGWDWFSLHLAGGDKLMLFRLRSDTGQPFASGSWIAADGTTEAIDPSSISMQELEHQRVAGRKLPVSWRLQIASRNLDLEVTALNAQAWMGTSIPYWEGPVRVGGSHEGMGYLEMTGY